MTGSLSNAMWARFRDSGLSVFCGVALSAAALGAGCNGFVPPTTAPGNNPTEFSEIEGCATSYSDSEYNYGFDLPAEASIVRTKNETNSLTNSLWTLTQADSLINIVTRVQGASAGADLGTLVAFANDLSVSAGADLLVEEEAGLANAGQGMQTIVRFDGLTTFRVQALFGNHLYTVEAVVEEEARTPEMDAFLAGIGLSLCIGN
jgi:hypothetical protein